MSNPHVGIAVRGKSEPAATDDIKSIRVEQVRTAKLKSESIIPTSGEKRAREALRASPGFNAYCPVTPAVITSFVTTKSEPTVHSAEFGNRVGDGNLKWR